MTSSAVVEATPNELAADDRGNCAPFTANLPPPAIRGLWLRSSRPPSIRELLFGATLFLSDAAAMRPDCGSCLCARPES